MGIVTRRRGAAASRSDRCRGYYFCKRLQQGCAVPRPVSSPGRDHRIAHPHGSTLSVRHEVLTGSQRTVSAVMPIEEKAGILIRPYRPRCAQAEGEVEPEV